MAKTFLFHVSPVYDTETQPLGAVCSLKMTLMRAGVGPICSISFRQIAPNTAFQLVSAPDFPRGAAIPLAFLSHTPSIQKILVLQYVIFNAPQSRLGQR